MKPNPSNNFDPMQPTVSRCWSKVSQRPFKTRIYSAMNMQAVTVLHFMITDSPYSYTHHRDEMYIGQKQWKREPQYAYVEMAEMFDKQIKGTPVKCDYLVLRKAELEAEIEQLENDINANIPSVSLTERYNTVNKWLRLVNDLIEEKCQK